MNKCKSTIICDDSLNYMQGKKFDVIITSLPDMEEVGLNKQDWILWVKKTCKILANTLGNKGIIFFYQTDRKNEGEIIDKKTLISNEFITLGYKNVLSKIVLKRDVGKIDLFRPTYTNLFAFSKFIKSGKATPDVLHCGKMIYNNAMGLNAVKVCIDFLKDKGIKSTILDPFCGQGSVLIISNHYGFDAVGVEILPEQAEKSRIYINKFNQ